MKKTALSIAGFDPTGWAGVLADVGVFRDFGLGASSAVTALTVQDLESVSDVRPVEPGLLGAQIESAFRAQAVSGVKIGMLGTGANVEAVAKALQKHGPHVAVLDPVLGSTRGAPLLDKDGINILKNRLMPLSSLVTPNLGEAAALTGLEVADAPSMREAARIISHEFGAGAVLVKGGHLKGLPVDILYDRKVFQEFPGKRLAGPAGAFHGTGCLLSSAITAGLITGLTLFHAVKEAKAYVEKTLRKRVDFLRNRDQNKD